MTDTDPRWIDEHGNEIDEDHRGLVYDVRTLVDRRRALGIFGGIAAHEPARRVQRRVDTEPSASATGTSTPTATATPTPTAEASGPARPRCPTRPAARTPPTGRTASTCSTTPGIVRSDIRSSFGSSTTVAEGVPLTIALTVRDAATGSALAGARRLPVALRPRRRLLALQRAALENENYLRGVQETDATGTVRVHLDLPGLLLGPLAAHPLRGLLGCRDRRRLGADREDLADRPARGGRTTLVYATAGYEQSVRNASQGQPAERQRVRRRRRHPPDRDDVGVGGRRLHGVAHDRGVSDSDDDVGALLGDTRVTRVHEDRQVVG